MTSGRVPDFDDWNGESRDYLRAPAMLRLIAINFSIVAAGQVANGVMAFLFIAFVARQFGPELFGKLILIGSYVRVVSLIVTAGLFPIAVRELARQRDKPESLASLFDDILSLGLVLGVAGYAILMLVLTLFSEHRELMVLMTIAAFPLVFDAFTTSYAAYYTAHQRESVLCIYYVVLTSVSIGVGVAVVLGGFGLLGLITSDVVIRLLGTIILSVIFRRGGRRFTIRARLASWWRLVLLIVPFVPIYTSIQLNRVLSVILLGRLPGPLPTAQSVGYYSPAQSITNSAVLLLMGLRKVMISPITVKLGQGFAVTREIDLAMKLVLAIFCLPLALGCTFMAPEIISLLFGEQYAPSAVVLVILVWSGALQIASMVPETFLFAHPDHNLQDYAPGAIISVLVNIVVCVLLIPHHGVVGAAIAAVCARLVFLAFASYYCRRQMHGTALRLRDFLDVAVLGVSSFVLWYAVTASIDRPWIALAVSAVLTLPLLAAFILFLRSRWPVAAAE